MLRVLKVLSGRTAGRAAQLLSFFLLAQSLAPEKFGYYSLLLTSIALVSQLASIGLRQGAATCVGYKIIPKQTAASTLLWSSVPLAFFAVCILNAFIYFDNYYEMIMVFLATLGALLVIFMQGILLGDGRIGFFGISESAMPLLLASLIIILYFFDHISYTAAICSLSISYITAAVVSVLLALQGSGVSHPNISDLFIMASKGIAFALNIFLVMLSARISLFIVEAQLSASVVGIYFAGQKISEMFGEIATAVGLVLFSDGLRSDDKLELLKKNVAVAGLFLWGFGAVSLILVIFAGDISSLLLGSAYSDSSKVLAITALAIGPSAASKILYASISSMGRPLQATPSIVISILINGFSCWLLLPAYGVEAASAAYVASQLCLLLGYGILLRRSYGISLIKSLRIRIPKL